MPQKAKLIKIDPSLKINPFDHHTPKVNPHSYIGKVGTVRPSGEEDVYLVTFPDGKTGSFISSELEFLN